MAVQYVDYTLWQRAQLGDLEDSASRIAAQLAYWEDALAGMPERLQLPTDRPYPPVADYRGASVAVEWPAEVQQRVRQVAREHNATSFMVVQAALGGAAVARSAPVLMWRWGFRSRGGVIRRWMSWWGFSSTRWCCGWIWAVIPPSPSCWPRCDSAAWPPTSTRTCPLRCWWSGSTRPDSLTHHPLVQVMLAWQNFPGRTLTLRRVDLGDLQVTPLPAGYPHRAHGSDVLVGRALDRGR